MWNLNTTTSHSIHSEYIDFEDKAAKRQSEEIDQAFEDVNVELRSKCALFFTLLLNTRHLSMPIRSFFLYPDQITVDYLMAVLSCNSIRRELSSLEYSRSHSTLCPIPMPAGIG